MLDQGFVALLASMGNDLTIVNAARVSLGKRKAVFDESDAKLLAYLLAHRHTTPFEHVTFQFHVKCPLFVARQWMRHRTWSYNEISRRYTSVDLSVHHPTELRGQGATNRQASAGTADSALCDVYGKAVDAALATYEALVAAGVCREQARGVLPSAMYTEFYATVDLHNLLHFIDLREAPDAQPEIQVYATALRELITSVVPQTMAARAAQGQRGQLGAPDLGRSGESPPRPAAPQATAQSPPG